MFLYIVWWVGLLCWCCGKDFSLSLGVGFGVGFFGGGGVGWGVWLCGGIFVYF